LAEAHGESDCSAMTDDRPVRLQVSVHAEDMSSLVAWYCSGKSSDKSAKDSYVFEMLSHAAHSVFNAYYKVTQQLRNIGVMLHEKMLTTD